MTMGAAQFQADIYRKGLKWKSLYSGYKTDLTLMATALGSDATLHDRTIEQPLGILGNGNSPYQIDINTICNIGRAGNLPAASMAAALTAVVAALP